jgi:ketosteroid isomerase-like protein
MEGRGSSDVENLGRLYDRWSLGDYTAEDIFDPGVEMDTFGMGEPMRASGVGDVAATLGGWLSAWERPLVIEADELIPAGTRILALVRWRGRGKGSGVEMESEGAHLWTFRDGLAVRFDVYRDRDEARAALTA